MTLTLGELCAGYNGLGMAVEEVFNARPAWFSEYEAAPSKVLAHHWPTVPNHGDMTQIDWAAVEPVDIISGGTPCQDLSHAGKRAGMTEGTRSNLWAQMREAIATIRPRYVVWENVRGAYSAAADSDVELCPGCVGDGSGVNLRALGRVLGDLCDLGYDAAWHGLTAASVGAPHGRFRVFVLAWDTTGRYGWGEVGRGIREGCGEEPTGGAGRVVAADASGEGLEGRRRQPRSDEPALTADRGATQDADCPTCGQRWQPTSRQEEGRRARPDPGRRGGAPATDTPSNGRHQGWAESAGLVGGSDASLGGDADRDALRLEPVTISGSGGAAEPGHAIQWGQYGPAIRRWEGVLGRPAPAPTETTPRGSQRLSARFVEWMMAVPAGHVTDPAIGLTRNEQLKALGNGVVAPQAAAALHYLLAATESARAA